MIFTNRRNPFKGLTSINAWNNVRIPVLCVSTVLLGLCVLCSSCNHSELVDGDSFIYMELSIAYDTPTTKTVIVNPDPEEENERKISDMSVFLVSMSDPSNVYQVRGVPVNTDDVEFEESTSVYKYNSAMIQIPKEKAGNYYIYVVTNTGGNSAFVPQTESEGQFISTGDYDYGPYVYENAKKFWTPNQFMMTNFQNEVGGYAGVPVSLTESNTKENPLSVTVTVERLALKIVVREDPNIVTTPVGMSIYGTERYAKLVSMKIDGVCLLNCATQFNLIQQWAYAPDGSGRIPSSPDPLKVPTAAHWYPNLYLVSPSSSLSPLYPIGLDGYYNRYADLVNPATFEINNSIVFGEVGKPMYCFENNSPYYEDLIGTIPSGEAPLADYAKPKTKMKGRTTAVAVRVRCKIAESGYITEDLTIDPEEGLWTKAGDDTYRTFYQYDNICYLDLPKLLSEHPELATAGITESSTISELRQKGVKVFEDGVMYYIHWIKDSEYTDGYTSGDKTPYNYYSVMRNTYYGLNVTGFSVLGDDIPGGEDYNEYDPIDSGDLRMTVYPVVLDWTPVPFDVTL